MASANPVLDLRAVQPADVRPTRVGLLVHDATRVAWTAIVPLPEHARVSYTLEVQLEVPAKVAGALDGWSSLQSSARVEGVDRGVVGARSAEAFRRDVVDVCARVARARDGFIRHCALVRAGSVAEENQCRALRLWVAVASAELARARDRLLRVREPQLEAERGLADEFLSAELWAGLTDCAEAFFETQRALEGRSANDAAVLEGVEGALAAALGDEIAYRKSARFPLAEPVNALQLERLLAKMRQMKRHFERVIALDADRHEVLGRPAAWLAPLAALALYAWFFFTQIAEARGAVAAASAFVAFALVAAWAYASRDRIKEIARLPRSIVVRKTRFRMPVNGRRPTSGSGSVPPPAPSAKGAAVARARESFVEGAPRRDVTVFRFVHRATAERPAALEGYAAPELRMEFRLDLSAVLARLDAPVRGLAAPDARTGRVAIVDVPRTYDLPIRATLRIGGRKERIEQVLVTNKNGLVRLG